MTEDSELAAWRDAAIKQQKACNRLREQNAKMAAALRDAHGHLSRRPYDNRGWNALLNRIEAALPPAAQGEGQPSLEEEWTELEMAGAGHRGISRRGAPASPSPGLEEMVLVPREPTRKQLEWIANKWTCTVEEAAETYGDLIDYLAAASTAAKEPT